MPGVLDHLLVAVLLLVQPVYSAIKGPGEVRAMRDPAVRRRTYRWTLASEWIFAAAIVGVWLLHGRSWSELGLGRPAGWGFAAAAALSFAVAVSLQRQLWQVRREPRLRESVRAQVGELEALVPSGPEDLRLVRSLTVTAGVCEELAYRGFLLWYLTAWLDVWVAAPLTALAFGAAHLYQGPRHALRIVLIGLASVLLYLLAGSLWLPMLMHAFVDLNQIEMLRVARQDPEVDALAA